jgi:hypothetical protein
MWEIRQSSVVECTEKAIDWENRSWILVCGFDSKQPGLTRRHGDAEGSRLKLEG